MTIRRRAKSQQPTAERMLSEDLQAHRDRTEAEAENKILTHFAMYGSSNVKDEQTITALQEYFSTNKNDNKILDQARKKLLKTYHNKVTTMFENINLLKLKTKKDKTISCVLETVGALGQRIEGAVVLNSLVEFLVTSGSGQLLATGLQELPNIMYCLFKHTCSTIINVPSTLSAIVPVITQAYKSLGPQLQGVFSVIVVLLLLKGGFTLVDKSVEEVRGLLGRVQQKYDKVNKFITIRVPAVLVERLGIVETTASALVEDGMVQFSANIGKLGDNAILRIGNLLQSTGAPLPSKLIGAAGEGFAGDADLSNTCVETSLESLQAFFQENIFKNLEMTKFSHALKIVRRKLEAYNPVMDNLDNKDLQLINFVAEHLERPEGGAPAASPVRGGGRKTRRKTRKPKRKSKRKKSRAGYKHKKTKSKKQRRRRN